MSCASQTIDICPLSKVIFRLKRYVWIRKLEDKHGWSDPSRISCCLITGIGVTILMSKAYVGTKSILLQTYSKLYSLIFRHKLDQGKDSVFY